MDSIKDRILRSVAQRGILGTIPMCWWSVLSLIRPTARHITARREQVDAEFDRTHGVRTGGNVRPKSTAVIGNNWLHGVSYQAVDPEEFHSTLAELQIPFAEFTFIDFGCGKGRALILAAEFPFRKIVGVEYCSELSRIARENLTANKSRRKCDAIEVIDADATLFELPDGPLLLYFFNPFGEPVMQKVANNVLQKLHISPERIVVVYFTPYHANVWEKTGIFHRLKESPAVFETALR
jgi:Predicted RNA methylase